MTRQQQLSRCLGCMLLLVTWQVPADEILVIGDSWAAPIALRLGIVLQEAGHAEVPVHYDYPTNGLSYWGGPRNLDSPEGRQAISSWLAAKPNANYMYFMMGQNNWLCCWTFDMVGTQAETDLFNSIIGHMEAVLDHVLSIRPGMQVVWTLGDYLRPHHLAQPPIMNANYDRMLELAVAFAEGRPELTVLEWNGLLQVAFGFDGIPYSGFDPNYVIPPGDPSLPDATLPTPFPAFRNTAHPNSEGYFVMAEAVYDRYFAARLGPQFTINAGLNDAWVSDDAPFQGMFITVYPGLGVVFVAMFTFDSELPAGPPQAVFGADDQRWATGLGAIDGNRVVFSMELTSGGVFNSGSPMPTQQPGYGTMTIEFLNCEQASVEYEFPSINLSGSMEIERVLNSNVALCEALAAEPAAR